jgi:two-component system response regulator DegU
MKVLIVVDSLSVRQILKSVVAAITSEIDECGDGREAVDLYESRQPDFVLMDIDLGEMDGITATRQIRAGNPNAKIIIVTNYDENDFREAAHEAGACGYVLKENLLEVLELLVTNSNQ